MSRKRKHARALSNTTPSARTDSVTAVAVQSYARCEASGYQRAANGLSAGLSHIGILSEVQNAQVVVHVGDPRAWRPVLAKRNVGFCWWPFSRVNDEMFHAFNGMDTLLVPSTWCADGARTPKPNQRVAVVPIAPDEAFVPVERERGDTLRLMFFDSGAAEYRAGADLAIAAFKAAFPIRDDVHLDIYSTRIAEVEKNDSRIQIHRNIGDDIALARIYRQHDALIYSSRGEGAAFVALEAMASGLPVIHTGQTAMSDFADVGQLVGSRKVRVPVTIQPLSETFEPWLDLLVDRLRQFDAQFEKWQSKAAADADTVRSFWTWERSARALVDALGGSDVPTDPADVSVGSGLQGAA